MVWTVVHFCVVDEASIHRLRMWRKTVTVGLSGAVGLNVTNVEGNKNSTTASEQVQNQISNKGKMIRWGLLGS